MANKAARNVWGQSCTVGGETIVAILDEAWIEALSGSGEVAQSGFAPVLDVRLADLSVTPVVGVAVVTGGVNYSVIDIRKDGNGGAKLIMNRV